jgi:RNA polymerase sigma-70 factor (ECF subfamily)
MPVSSYWVDSENVAFYAKRFPFANQCAGREKAGSGIYSGHRAPGTAVATNLEIDHFLAEVERRAYKHAFYAIQDHHAALDVVQVAMMKLVESYADRPVRELPMLFHRILQNRIHDHFRRAKVRDYWVRLVSPLRDKDEDNSETLESLAAAVEDCAVPSPEQVVSQTQHLAMIEQALTALPPRQREAFLLRYWEGMDVAETAKIMGCSQGSVKTHSFRAVHAMAQKLQEMGLKP